MKKRMGRKMAATAKDAFLFIAVIAAVWCLISAVKVLMLASWKAVAVTTVCCAFLYAFYHANYKEGFNE